MGLLLALGESMPESLIFEAHYRDTRNPYIRMWSDGLRDGEQE